jgi:hypothetical protein
MVQNQELYGEMRSLLTSIGERAQGTHVAVTAMNERLLGAVLEKYSRERGIAVPDEQLVQDVARLVSDQQSQQTSQRFMPRVPKHDDAARLEMLRTFPEDDQLQQALGVLQTLNPVARADFATYGSDERTILEIGDNTAFDPGLGNPVDGLLEGGLVAEIPGSPQVTGRSLYALTPEGRKVVRLLIADEPIPSAIESELRPMREAIAEFRKSLS